MLFLSIGIVVACCSVVGTFSVLGMINSNQNLRMLQDSLHNYPLPPNTHILERLSSLEGNQGTGDYCIFIIHQTMSTTLSQEEILKYYENLRIPGVNELGDDAWIKVDIDESIDDSKPWQFTIEVEDQTERMFDFRCR